ncbi:hypothetical protein FRB96_006056 [Tulasnella sp. 330]|nr:hypothetical protein FRB96_006056 [Tulasnella sp. 330]KAG8876743.1 hypothetical protein FRB97_003957 [Tulasnella sp. 331]KAG8883856.1 hypothetical protein FRB98_002768 [Tulasnella sp. 332]
MEQALENTFEGAKAGAQNMTGGEEVAAGLGAAAVAAAGYEAYEYEKKKKAEEAAAAQAADNTANDGNY